ncbi:MAG: hypothetical protein LBI30_01565 [Holosporales bacterium]|jgi:hypothetical protein|nr:hypothetical protein [Holosporales bacterium]
MQGCPRVLSGGPVVVEEFPQDFGAEFDVFFDGLSSIQEHLLRQFAEVSGMLRSPDQLPEDPMSLFRAKYSMVIDDMGRKFSLDESEVVFFRRIVEQGVILIDLPEAESTRKFREENGLKSDLFAGYYSGSDRKIRVAVSSVAQAMSVSAHESGHAFADQRLTCGDKREHYSMFFQIASFFSALDARVLTKQEAMQLAVQFQLTMLAELMPVCANVRIVKENPQEELDSIFGFNEYTTSFASALKSG